MWKPVSIGGQSGSSVRRMLPNGKSQAEILLTWSWNNNGAGQPTSLIFNNIQNKSNVGPVRPPGLIEVGYGVAQCEDGYFESPEIESMSIRVGDLPIWADDDDVVDPPPAEGLTAEETAAALNLKAAGFSIVRVAEFHVGLLQKKTLTLSDAIPDASMLDLQPFVDPNPTRVGSPTVAGWTPPPLGPGELYNEGQIHNGRILTKVCDGSECHHEWQLVDK